MGFGIFGKLPQKRDFIAFNMPRAVLEPFETWLQSAVAASRNELGAAWPDHYLVAPIWRFWIGKAILGTCCAGALMPSVDGAGRFFPLVIMYLAEADGDVAPPPFDPLEAWYAAIEQRLLTVLDEFASIEVERLADGLAPPESAATMPGPAGRQFKHGNVWEADGGGAHELLSVMIPADYWASAVARSFWWTNGGSNTGPVVYVRNALPDPYFFADMIRGTTGRGERK